MIFLFINWMFFRFQSLSFRGVFPQDYTDVELDAKNNRGRLSFCRSVCSIEVEAGCELPKNIWLFPKIGVPPNRPF